MYKWRITYHMKNGTELFGIYHGKEHDSGEVAKVLLTGDLNNFNGCRTSTGNGALFVRNGDITAIEVSTYD